MPGFTSSFIFTAQFSCFLLRIITVWDSLERPASAREEGRRRKNSKGVIEAKFVLTLSCGSYKLARRTDTVTIPSEIVCGGRGVSSIMDGQTLQMNLVFGALNQNGADRIEVVIVTASERARPCFGHLEGEKKKKNRRGTIIYTAEGIK